MTDRGRVLVIGLLAVILAADTCEIETVTPQDAGEPDAGDTCDQIATRYLNTAADLGYCSVASDCWAYAADCAITTHGGAPACQLLLNQEADQTQLADMSVLWKTFGCPTVEACGTCTPAPVLDCQGGACVALE